MPLPSPADVSSVATIGCGTIGASWTAWFLAKGLDVRASDPDPAKDGFLVDYVRNAWPALVRLDAVANGGETAEAALARLTFTTDPVAAVEGAHFVQESAYERLDLKQDLLQRIDAALPADVVISSSTSGFMPSELQARMARPERLVVGHPFNPPHLIPLVEVIGGKATAKTTVDWMLDWYRHVGKHPIRIEKEVMGHVANRLQAAIWREAVHLAVEGVASVEDIDAAIAYGPGLRWAIMGPHLTFHLAGGTGGYRHFFEQLAPGVERWWGDLGTPRLTDDVKAALGAGIEQAIGGRSYGDLTGSRDEALLGILEALAEARRAKG
jgi:carnitine 3-dehydrogenase